MKLNTTTHKTKSRICKYSPHLDTRDATFLLSPKEQSGQYSASQLKTEGAGKEWRWQSRCKDILKWLMEAKHKMDGSNTGFAKKNQYQSFLAIRV